MRYQGPEATAMSDQTQATMVGSAVEQLAEAFGVDPKGVTVEVDHGIGTTVIDGGEVVGDGDQSPTETEDSPEGAEDGDDDQSPMETEDTTEGGEDTDEVGELECSCGRVFDSEAALNGHSAHCDGKAVEDTTEGGEDTEGEVTEGEAKEATKGLGESLPELMDRGEASFKGKVASGISDADDRAKLFKYRFGTCSEAGCDLGCNGEAVDRCGKHQKSSTSNKSEQSSDDDGGNTTEGGDEVSKADFVSQLMEEGLSALEAAEKAEAVYGE